jgi:hypothetical protein
VQWLKSTDTLKLARSSVATLDVVTSWADNNAGTITEDREVHAFSTAATDDFLDAPSSPAIRKPKDISIRNKDAALSCDVTVIYNANGTSYEMLKVTLRPGETLAWNEATGFFTYTGVLPSLVNESVSSQTPFSSDTYLVGSNISIPAGLPIVGTFYNLVFDVAKTNAGTATPIITVRIGTAGTTADAARCTLTFGAGTAAVDTGIFEVGCYFRTVGSGTSAILQGRARLTSNLTTTGISNAVKAVLNTGGGFDSTVANLIIGASYNGGASAAHTIQMVRAELVT